MTICIDSPYPSSMKSKVAIVRCADYEPMRVKAALDRAFELLGGVGAFIKPGEKVLVKPNLLSARPPEAAVTTHPVIVESVIQLLMRSNAQVRFGDSPPLAAETVSGYKR